MSANCGVSSNRKIPSLVQYCQRVAANHLDSINYLGDDLSYDLLKPILERCSVEQLLKLERLTPRLQDDTSDIWKELCFRKYPIFSDRYHSGDVVEPESWKNQYFLLQEAEAKRLEEIGSRLRMQRSHADELKKEKEIKLTDRVPPMKRSRWSDAPALPKTLFQKTRSEASKLQKNMSVSRMIRPAPADARAPLKSPVVPLLPLLPSTSNRVTVNTVRRHASLAISSNTNSMVSSVSGRPVGPSSSIVSSVASAQTSGGPSQHGSERQAPRTSVLPAISPFLHLPHTPTNSRPSTVLNPTKKNPMASLFLPKHRAHSQRTATG